MRFECLCGARDETTRPQTPCESPEHYSLSCPAQSSPAAQPLPGMVVDMRRASERLESSLDVCWLVGHDGGTICPYIVLRWFENSTWPSTASRL